MTGDLAGWLRAQLDVDEQTARAAAYWDRFDPAFTLADITAKRAILDLHQPTETDWYGPTQIECVCCIVTDYPCLTLRLLAQPYAGRPGWHNEWSVT